MVYPGIIAAAAVAAGVAWIGAHCLRKAVSPDAFWKDIINFQKKTLEGVSQITGKEALGEKVFLKKVREGIQIISKFYYKSDEEWEEATISKITPETEVPPDVLEKLSYSEELDITDMLTAWLEERSKSDVWIKK